MQNGISFWVSIAFIVTTLSFTLMVYYTLIQSKVKITRANTTKIFIGVIIWLLIQLILSTLGVYANYTYALPPFIFLFGILPVLIFIIYLLISAKGKAFIKSLPLEYLTNIHIIRIPVEFILCYLFFDKAIPKGMTFLGSNFDIIIGITAPLFSFLYFKQKAIPRNVLLVWNFIGILFLLHIVIIGILSAPSPIQQLNFNQPNKAILYFPFSWLVTFIVPIVLFCHIVSIIRLLKPEEYEVAIPTISEFYKS